MKANQTKFVHGIIKPRLRGKSGGFTIIEIIIVLAVAGVIMAVVLLTVPQAQRNQRDNSRRALAQRLMSSLENYNANNQGTYPFNGSPSTPTDWTDCSNAIPPATQNCYEWYSGYVAGKINIGDPSTSSNIGIFYSKLDTNPSTRPGGNPIQSGDVFIGVGDVCSGSALGTGQPGNPASKQFAMIMALENSGTWSCVDNR